MAEAPPGLPPWPRGIAAMSPEDAFAGTWARSGPTMDASKRQAVWDTLAEAYRSPQRYYHNFTHILETLAFVGMTILSGRQLEDQAAVEWTLWFHDVVYDPKVKDGANEEASARLAESLLSGAGLPAPTVARVGALIRATATHLHNSNPDEHVVVDADLSVLGAPPARYAQYAISVRKEYGHMSDSDFSEGRTKFLRTMLEREQLFATDEAKSLLEQQARTNLAHELQLTSVGLLLTASIEDELPAVAEGVEEGEEADGDAIPTVA